MLRPSRLSAGLIAATLSLASVLQPVAAQTVSTEAAAAWLAGQSEQGESDRARLQAALDRADLAQALVERGVAVAQLRERVAALTDAEAAELLRQIDSAPAGADIVGTLFTVFVILLVTDILGLTKVFPFTRPVR